MVGALACVVLLLDVFGRPSGVALGYQLAIVGLRLVGDRVAVEVRLVVVVLAAVGRVLVGTDRSVVEDIGVGVERRGPPGDVVGGWVDHMRRRVAEVEEHPHSGSGSGQWR